MADLADGETTEIKGSAAKPYVLKNTGGVYSCNCPAWRNQSAPIERRTCKHLRTYRGDEAEQERVGGELPARAKSASKKDGPALLLAQSWDNQLNLASWWMSEKLDGVRAYWDGQRFLSRWGNVFHAPDWFIADLPETPLDGELWIDRKKFQRTVSVVRRQDKSDHWKEVRYLVFDAPRLAGEFEARLAFLGDVIGHLPQDHIVLHAHVRCEGVAHLESELGRIEALGGEGLMLRQPGSQYEIGRSSTLLKVKRFHDAEATVLGHQPGKGKHKGRLGALQVQLSDGTEFSVGTGFSDAQRASPPPVGSRVTFRYQELSDGGVPRFPSFVRVRDQAVGDVSEGDQAATTLGKKKVGGPARKQSSPSPANASDAGAAAPGMRYFEFADEKSSKFWAVSRNGSEVTVRYGRIGTAGTTKVKTLDSPDAAQQHEEKLVAEKTGKGYVEP